MTKWQDGWDPFWDPACPAKDEKIRFCTQRIKWLYDYLLYTNCMWRVRIVDRGYEGPIRRATKKSIEKW